MLDKKKYVNKLLFYLILLFVIIFYTIIRKGSYFQIDKYLSIIIFSIFSMTVFFTNPKENKKIIFIKNKLNFVILLSLIYFVFQFFNSLYIRSTIEEFNIFIIGFVILYSIYQIFNEQDIEYYIWGFFIIGIVIASIPYLAKFGLIKNNGFIINDRFASTFQYPNAFATFLLILIYISLIKYHETGKTFFSVLTSFFSITLYLTQSRASLVVVIFIIFLSLFIKIPNKIKLLFEQIYFILFLPILFILFTKYIYFILSLILILSHLMLFNYLYKKFKINYFIKLIPILIFTFLLMFLIKNDIILRIKSLFEIKTYIGAGGMSGRNSLILTSINIFKSYPIFGSGPGTYQYIYFKYRPVLIFSKFPHSTPFQILSEYGIIGFILYLSFIYFIIIKLIELLKTKKYSYLYFIIPYIIILLRSIIDFDLSIPSIFYLFFIFTGIILTLNKNKKDLIFIKYKTILPYLVSIFSFIIILNLFFSISSLYFNKGLNLFLNNYNDYYYFEVSKNLDLLNSEKYFYLGRAYENIALKEKDINYMNKANNFYIKAINLNPMYFLYHSYLGINYYYLNDKEKSLLELKKAIELNPLDYINYVNLANIYEKYNMIEEAIDQYKKALKLDTNNKEIIKKLIALGDKETSSNNVLCEIKFPIGKEKFNANEKIKIEWDIYGNIDLIDHYTLKFSSDNGKTYKTISQYIEKEVNNYEYQLPNLDSNDCVFLLLIKDKNNNVIEFYKTPPFGISK